MHLQARQRTGKIVPQLERARKAEFAVVRRAHRGD